MISILYVDDEEDLLKVNKIYLERTGEFSVEMARSAEDALRMIGAKQYDAVVSDYDMPVMNGIQFLQEVRSRYGDLPFLLFTGKGREEIVIQAVDNGVDFYIQKGHDMHGMIAELGYKIKRAVERRRVRHDLERSRRETADIINFLPDATFVRDIRGQVIAWNKAMERMTGIPREAMLGKADYEYAIPLYNERRPLLADRILEKESQEGQQFQYGNRNEDKLTSEVYIPHFNNGNGAYLAKTAGPLYDSNGEIIGAIESFRDITDYFAIRRDLRRSNDMIQGFADIIPVGIYEMDLGYNLTFSNRVCRELFGFDGDRETQSLPILDYVDPEDRDRVIHDLKGLVTRISGTGHEYRLLRKDKSTFPALIYGGLIIDPDTQKPAGVRGVIIDISTRKKEAQELHESRERLMLALQAGNTGVWDVDLRTLTIFDIHEWAQAALGYDKKDLPLITVDIAKSLVHPLDLPRILAAFLSHMSGRDPHFAQEFRLAAKDRRWVRVAVRGTIIERNPRNEPVRVTGVINVITPQVP